MMTEKKTDDSDTTSQNNIAFVERFFRGQDLFSGISTGYERIDELTAGLRKPDLIIIAGRPSMGKTALALNIATYVAMVEGITVGIFSMDESKDHLALRMLASEAKVSSKRIREGDLQETDSEKLCRAAGKLKEAPIFIDDTKCLTVQDIQRKTRILKADHGLGLVVIDYLQLMTSNAYRGVRDQEIADITRTLKAMGKELGVPIIAISQLNRKVDDRANRRPQLSDLRDSGAIEDDADVIAFIYRDDVYNSSSDNRAKGIAEIMIGKQRNGPTGVVKLAFLPDYACFENLKGDRYGR